MQGAIRDRLKALLRPEREANSSAEYDFLAALRGLKGPGNIELPASFYASVLRRIEEKKSSSVWYNLVASPVSTRMVYATLTAAVVIGSYVVGHEARDGHLETSSVMARNTHYDAAVYGDLDQQRNAVLTNFATH